MVLLPFALLHQDDFDKKMKEHLEKRTRKGSDCSTSGDSTRSCGSNSADPTPCASECGSPLPSPDLKPLDFSEFSLENSLSPEGAKNELGAFTLPPKEEHTAEKVLAAGACRWTVEELVERQILMEGEDIVLCGNILRRRFPLCRKNVLMLTNMPRLLVLHHSGDVLKQIPLRSDDTSIVEQGPYDFQVGTSDEIYKCRDAIIGADVWTNSVQAAREKVKHGRFF